MHQEWQRPWAAASSRSPDSRPGLRPQRDRADFAGGDRRGALDADRVDLLDLGARHPERGRPVRGGLSGHLGDGRERWPGRAHYQQLRTALLSGEGAPDVAQMEFQFIPSFVVTESLLDLTPYGAAELEGDYVPWVWAHRCRRRCVEHPAGHRPDGQPVPSRHPRAGWRDCRRRPGRSTRTPPRRSGTRPTRTSRTSAPNDAGQLIGLLWQAGVKPFGYDGAEAHRQREQPGGQRGHELLAGPHPARPGLGRRRLQRQLVSGSRQRQVRRLLTDRLGSGVLAGHRRRHLGALAPPRCRSGRMVTASPATGVDRVMR